MYPPVLEGYNVGLQILRNRIQLGDTSLLSEAQWYLGNIPNKLI